MPSENKLLLVTPTEKPSHYRYLKEFRVDACPLFPMHKCPAHRPFTCFNYHFPNQKRRRSLRKRDGTFNYSPDNYCTKYDETSGICPDGDECAFLHRNAGDTERRYHLRYFKTCVCVYETDNRGFCTKNGAHCAFAHGDNDKRPPVYDVKELQQNQDLLEEALLQHQQLNGPSLSLNNIIAATIQPEKIEKCILIEDPKWQDPANVLVFYKTEACKRPPRLCRQGYACPQYHNTRDRRRCPKTHKYRSTPCPTVKHGDEWGEPSLCEEGEDCPYCHTRTEQQFHPEIYKSTKCNDIYSTQHCPRGLFCAFAHADIEMSVDRNMSSDNNLADILSNVLPSNSANDHNDTLDKFMGNMKYELQKNGGIGTLDFSDRIGSPFQDYNSHLLNTSFGNQSFASAARGSSSNNINCSNNLNGKYFDDDNSKKLISGLDDLKSLTNDLPMDTNGKSFNIMPNSNIFLDNHIETIFDPEGPYCLFPSRKEEDGRDDSPNAEKDNLDSEFGSGVDISISSGTKPMSIPVRHIDPGSNFFRERFSSGSPLLPSNLNNLNNPIGLLFKDSNHDHSNDLINNHLSWESFSPSQSTLSLLSSNSLSNGFHGSKTNGAIGTSTNGNIGNKTISSNSNNNNNNNDSISLDTLGNNSNNNNGLIMNILGRSDLAYLSVQTLNQYEQAFKLQLEAVTNALNSHHKDSTHFPCLHCKNKERGRTVVLVPCDHQVLCANCAPSVSFCPLCHAGIKNRKQAIPYSISEL